MNNSLASLGFDPNEAGSLEPIVYGARRKLADGLQNEQGYPAGVIIALGTITPDTLAALGVNERDLPTLIQHSLTGLMIDPDEVNRWDSYNIDRVRVFPYSGSDIANQFQLFPGTEYQFTHQRWVRGDLNYINKNSFAWKRLADQGWNPMYHPTAQDILRWPSVAHFSNEAIIAARNLGSVTEELMFSARERILAHYLAQVDHGDFFPNESIHRHPKDNHRYDNLLELLEAQFKGQDITPDGYSNYLTDLAQREGIPAEKLALLLKLVTHQFVELENEVSPGSTLAQDIKIKELLQNNIFDPRWLHWFKEDNVWSGQLNLEVVGEFDLPFGFNARTGIITDPTTSMWMYAASVFLQNPDCKVDEAVSGLIMVNSMFRKNAERTFTWVSSKGMKVEIPHITEYGKMFAYIVIEHEDGSLMLFAAPTAGDKIDEANLYTFLGKVELPEAKGKRGVQTTIKLEKNYRNELPVVTVTQSEKVMTTRTKRKSHSLPLPKE